MNRMELHSRKIGVLFGGRSSEREVSLKSGSAVLQSCLRSGYSAVGIDAASDLPSALRTEGIEVAFIALHGRWGEDGTVQGLLEMMGIPYTGAGVTGSAISIDKAVMKYIFTTLSIPTPAYLIITGDESFSFPLPFVVKPANEGSTIGISVVREEREIAEALRNALTYDNKLVVEQYVSGQEITVGVINGMSLPLVEVRPTKGFYDFEAKYTKGMTDYIVPARVDVRVAEKARETALAIYRHFGLAGCARIDMLIDDGLPLVIDINTSPGMTETSLVPKAWGHLGRSFDELVEEILMGAALKT